MKIKPYVERLKKSKEFKEFMTKYPNSFMAAGFFVLDLETGKHIHQVDYYMPSVKKMAAFTLDHGIQTKILDMLSGRPPNSLDLNTNIDLDALPGILTDEMRNRNMSEDIRKIVAVIQNIGGKKIWNINCILTGMEILKSHVEDESKTILKIEKVSLVDVMKHLPIQGIPGAQVAREPSSKGEVEEELKRLEELEQEIRKEKEDLKKGLTKQQSGKANTQKTRNLNEQMPRKHTRNL